MQVFYERLIISRFRLIARASRGTVLEDLCNRLDDRRRHPPRRRDGLREGAARERRPRRRSQELVDAANRLLPIFVEHALWRPKERAFIGETMRSRDIAQLTEDIEIGVRLARVARARRHRRPAADPVAVTATSMDRRAARRADPRRGRGGGAASSARSGSRRCRSARTRPRRSTSGASTRRPREAGIALDRPQAARRTISQEELLDVVGRAERGRRDRRDPRPAAAARAARRGARDRRGRPGQGRRRLPPVQRRPALPRAADARAGDAARDHGAARRVPDRARRARARS